MNNPQPHASALTTNDGLVLAASTIAICAIVGLWSGAQLATFTNSGEFMVDAPVFGGITVLVDLVMSDQPPAQSWPAQPDERIPGPGRYWAVSIPVAAIHALGAVAILTRLFSWRVGTMRGARLGHHASSQMGTIADAATLIVKGPVRGRFILGTIDNRLVATENRSLAPTMVGFRRNRIHDRQGERSGVAVIGPTGCGKSAAVIAGILEHDGPAILSSVAGDLFEHTVARRQQHGDVYVFDPLGVIGDLPDGVTPVSWSPLAQATTVSGAMAAAAVLAEANPSEGVQNATYFDKKGEAILWPILFSAAIGQRSMGDVVKWLATQDGNVTASAGGFTGRPDADRDEMRTILRTVIAHGDEAQRIQAGFALNQLEGIFRLDPRPLSDIYSTAQTMVQAWEDPNVSASSVTGHKGSVPLTLDLLVKGRNTLYVAQPLANVRQFRTVFGGLLGSLLKDQAYGLKNRSRGPLPELLFVIDEAANTPLQWLPEVAATCRAVGVLLVTVWQSKGQIDTIYQRQSGPLLTNHGTKVFFAGASDVEGLKYIEELGGHEELHSRSASSDVLGQSRQSMSDSTTFRPLLPGHVIRQAAPFNAVLIHGTLPPFHLVTRRWWEDSALCAAAAGRGPELGEWSVPAGLAAVLDRPVAADLETLRTLPNYIAERNRAVSDNLEHPIDRETDGEMIEAWAVEG